MEAVDQQAFRTGLATSDGILMGSSGGVNWRSTGNRWRAERPGEKGPQGWGTGGTGRAGASQLNRVWAMAWQGASHVGLCAPYLFLPLEMEMRWNTMCTPYTQSLAGTGASPHRVPDKDRETTWANWGVYGKISFGCLLRSNLHTIKFIPFFSEKVGLSPWLPLSAWGPWNCSAPLFPSLQGRVLILFLVDLTAYLSLESLSSSMALRF